MTKPLQIAFFSPYDPGDPMAMSGLPYQARRSLSKHCGNVDTFYPFQPRMLPAGKALRRIYQLFGQNYDAYNNLLVSRMLGRAIQRALANKQYDFAFVAFGHTMIAHLQAPCPLVVMTDATWRLLRDYPFVQAMSRRTKREIEQMERRALQNASLLIYSSPWAADSAKEDYGCDPSKIRVLPFGPNMESVPDTQQAVADRMTDERRSDDRCRLLFLGRDWERKGGDIALATLSHMQRLGVPAHLTICGCVPPPGSHLTDAADVTVLPMLDKNTPDDARQLERLFLGSDFLLLPTRADCTPLVFSEAGAFGLPIITTEVGGVSSVVAEGVNGALLPPDAGGDAYARRIAQIYQDQPRYHQLIQKSRQRYEDELNWDAWGREMQRIFIGHGLRRNGQCSLSRKV